VGPALDGAGYLRLRLQGVTHVVDLRDECCDDPDEMDALGIRWRRLPIVEGEAPTTRQLNDLMRWLEAEADEVPGASLYLHGGVGRARTATVAIALLMHQDLTLDQAQHQVAQVWPEAALRPAQRAFLDGLAMRLSGAVPVADWQTAGDG
jgi:protein-tyrosine phosphatase